MFVRVDGREKEHAYVLPGNARLFHQVLCHSRTLYEELSHNEQWEKDIDGEMGRGIFVALFVLTGVAIAVSAFNLTTAKCARPIGRRAIVDAVVTGTLAVVVADSTVASALDFDSFENGLIQSDTDNCDRKVDPKCKPKMSADEGLCFYGVGKDRQEACKRVKESGGMLPSSKKGERDIKGWVDNPIALQ